MNAFFSEPLNKLNRKFRPFQRHLYHCAVWATDFDVFDKSEYRIIFHSLVKENVVR